MTIKTPILSKLNHDKDDRMGRAFDLALEALNAGLAAKKIWNVEVNDAKFTLSNGVDRALAIICDRHRSARAADYVYEPWMQDFSGYCGFNQAAGRIKRLSKNAPKTSVMQDYLAALAEVALIWDGIQALKPFIIKGRRPNQEKTEAQIAIELKNTGVCAICDNRQKLSQDKMVHHGYQMSEYNHSGYRMGKCFGTDYLCYELSNEANIAFAPYLQSRLKGYKQALKQLKSSKIESFTVKRQKYEGNRLVDYEVVLKKGTPEFERHLENEIHQTEAYIRYTKSDIVANDAKIKNWTLQPLRYGR